MNAPSAAAAAVPTVTCCGGAREVSGSMHLVAANGRQFLLDCGLVLEHRASTSDRNRQFPFDPARIDAVVLSHAHIDHSGNLPTIVRQGFSGPIWCTAATRDLLPLLLADSARIHEHEARVANLWRPAESAAIEPLFSQADVDRTVARCVPLPYEEDREILPGIVVRLVDAGHVLGSAMIHLRLTAPGHRSSLTFTGDLGRPNLPILRSPAAVPAADLILCESTYGGQRHDPFHKMIESLRVLVCQTVNRGGKVLIPAFSLGRTQLVVHCLQQLRLRKQLPAVPIFVDSPLADGIGNVYRRHPECLTEEAARQLHEPVNFLSGPMLHHVKSVEESKQLNSRREPCIIVASSGMVEGGRIVHHLLHNVDDPRCTVILVSYQPRDTVGARLLEPQPTVRLLGREMNKWADVVVLRGFSSHADHPGLLAALQPLAGSNTRVRLVHGNITASEALADDLRQHGFTDVAIPQRGETMTITPES